MIRVTSACVFLFAAGACLEVREDPDPPQLEDAQGLPAPVQDASADAVVRLEDAAASDGDAAFWEGGTDAAFWEGGTDADRPGDAAGGGLDAAHCATLSLNNLQGVGALCTHSARELACPVSQTCMQGFALDGVSIAAPYYCTKTCSADADCGEEARCCTLAGVASKLCVLLGCPGSCE